MDTWVDSQQIMSEQQLCLSRAVFPSRSIKTGSLKSSHLCSSAGSGSSPQYGGGTHTSVMYLCRRVEGWHQGAQGKDAPRGQQKVPPSIFDEGNRRE